MGWRGWVVVALLAAVGVAAGAGLARWSDDPPRTLTGATPVVASPSVPTDPPVTVQPDPDTPALGSAHPTHPETVGQDPFSLTLPVPDGWTRSNSRAGVWTWLVPENPDHTYMLRVSLPSGFTTVQAAIDERIAALTGATGIEDFTLESRTGSTFAATYVLDGYRRVTLERFLSFDESGAVYATVALVGREADRDGMTSLLERITARARR